MLDLINKIAAKNIWDKGPVFCFTSDVDWSSEDVMKAYFHKVNTYDINPTLFVTHESQVVADNYLHDKINRGIHPNFLPGSSHGNFFEEVIENCKDYAPEAKCFRSHRAFDVTDTNHLLKNNYGFNYCSNYITILQSGIRPVLHESGLINFPVFFEDGTHLYNNLNLNFKHYIKSFISPGIKIISFHPMNFILNSPTLYFMRKIKDSMSREEYNNISEEQILKLQNKEIGIGCTVIDIIEFVRLNNFPVLSLKELYEQTIEQEDISETLLKLV
jgi:hypothetical protein